jgi:hypothetical protein
MSQLRIETTDNKAAFLPGNDISGIVVWQLDRPAEVVEVRLFWYTEGKGTQDVGIAKIVRFDNPGQEGGRPFNVKAPNGPYSLSGKLISIIWALEIIALPSAETERLNITISPTGAEILLPR